MIAHATYPFSNDLAYYLLSQGLTTDAALDGLSLSGKAAAAAAEWERATGWFPFLGGVSNEARYFDPPAEGRYLGLNAGLLSLASLAYGVATDGSGGTVMAQGQGFRLLPMNTAGRGLPAEAVEFLAGGYGGGWPYSGIGSAVPGGLSFGAGAAYGRAGSIEVIGQWGRQSALTDDVWQAILQKAAALCMPQIMGRISGGLDSFTEAGVTEKYRTGQGAELTASFDTLVVSYRRQPLYLP